MTGALAVGCFDFAALGTGLAGIASAGGDDCYDSPSVLTDVSGKNIIETTTTNAIPVIDAMAHLGIDDIDFLLVAACGADS